MSEFVATLPKTRRRKPLPPGFKIALAQVLWCHGWFTWAIVAYVTGSWHWWAVVIWATNVALAWLKPTFPQSAISIWGCVHWLCHYWKQWREP